MVDRWEFKHKWWDFLVHDNSVLNFTINIILELCFPLWWLCKLHLWSPANSLGFGSYLTYKLIGDKLFFFFFLLSTYPEEWWQCQVYFTGKTDRSGISGQTYCFIVLSNNSTYLLNEFNKIKYFTSIYLQNIVFLENICVSKWWMFPVK